MSGRGSRVQNDEDGAGMDAMALSIVTIRTVREPEPVCQSCSVGGSMAGLMNRKGAPRLPWREQVCETYQSVPDAPLPMMHPP
jgi:hypothetical protein